ncbi:MAG: helix-turn-helix domain-containing protein [Tannerella sp.]|jgi:hypothetical protein|nr:helix-turn-helix domain-containing protein [Tannerella sp.]
MKKEMIALFLLFAITLSFGFGCYLIYLKTMEKTIMPIQDFFYNVLRYEEEMRLEKSGLPFLFSNVRPNETMNPGIISLQTEDSVSCIKKNPEHYVKPILERQSHAIQTALMLCGYPMKAMVIDSLLTEKLHLQNIYAGIGIRYVNNLTKEIEDSKPGNSVYHETSAGLIPLGLNDEIGVQLFYKMSFLSILRQEPIPFVLLTVLWLAILSVSIVFLCRKSERKVAYIPVSEIKTAQGEELLLQICRAVYFDSVKLEIHCNDQVISLPGQVARLFTAFMEAPDYYLSNEQIEVLFWPVSNNNNNSSCTQLIRRTRKTIKPVHELKIENLNRKGYRLKITEE